jgi:5-methylcytosine-specific restriction endonuclease McrA
MASAPRRSCSSPGCVALCDDGTYCPAHKRSARRQQDHDRGTPNERGYDGAHRRLRLLCFQRDQWRCVDCGWEPDVVADCRRFELDDPHVGKVLDELRQRLNRGERHLHADHELPIAVRPDLRLVLTNLQTLCDRCHNRKTRLETAAGRRPGRSLSP